MLLAPNTVTNASFAPKEAWLEAEPAAEAMIEAQVHNFFRCDPILSIHDYAHKTTVLFIKSYVKFLILCLESSYSKVLARI